MSLLYRDWSKKLKFNSVRDSTDILHSNTLHILKRNGNEWRNVTTIIHQASGICKLCSPWWDPGDLWNVTHVTGWDTIWGNMRKDRQKSRLRQAQYTANIRTYQYWRFYFQKLRVSYYWRIVHLTKDNELEWMWEEADISLFEVPMHNLPEVTEETHTYLYQGSLCPSEGWSRYLRNTNQKCGWAKLLDRFLPKVCGSDA